MPILHFIDVSRRHNEDDPDGLSLASSEVSQANPSEPKSSEKATPEEEESTEKFAGKKSFQDKEEEEEEEEGGLEFRAKLTSIVKPVEDSEERSHLPEGTCTTCN